MLFTGLNLALDPGGAVRLTGPNGVGKSSLLRLIAGLLEPVSGTIERDGGIALADERPVLDPAKPLRTALAFWANIDGGGVDDVSAALDAVGLSSLADVPVRMLSTGQRRRATLARVIASRADIWLLDEPGNGLDDGALALLETAIAQHRASGGIVMIATHQAVALPGVLDIRLADQ